MDYSELLIKHYLSVELNDDINKLRKYINIKGFKSMPHKNKTWFKINVLELWKYV